MAAAVTKLVQAVKPHIPLIKFPPRGAVEIADASHTTVPVLSVASDTSSQIVSGFAAPVNMVKTETYSKPIGKTPRGSGIDADQLPGRYHRKPLEDVEMQYIMRGGPE